MEVAETCGKRYDLILAISQLHIFSVSGDIVGSHNTKAVSCSLGTLYLELMFSLCGLYILLLDFPGNPKG